MLRLLREMDAFRRPERLDQVLAACEADSRGRTGLENEPYPASDYLRACYNAASAVSARDLMASGLEGAALGAALDQQRTAAIAAEKRRLGDAADAT